MQVTETSAEGLRRQYKIVIPAAEIEDRINEQLETLRRDMRLPGFRPGKVPAALVRKRYGDDVRREVVQDTISKNSRKVLEDKGLRVAATPDVGIETLEAGQDLAFTLSVDLMPEIEIGDLSALQLEREVPVVDDTLIDTTVQQLAEAQPKYDDLGEDHAAQPGEMVKVNLSASADGESIAVLSGQEEMLPVGTERVSTIPELQTQLVGLKAGDRCDIIATIPDAFPEESLRGKTVTFATEVLSVHGVATPVADDDFAKSIGVESLAALRRVCRERLEKQLREVARLRTKRRLLDRLADDCKFPAPAAMVEAEFEGIWQRVDQQRQAGQLSEEDREKSEETLRADYRAIAERRVRLGLWLAEVGNRNGIEVTSEELRQAMIREARRYPGQEAKVIEFFKQNPESVQNLRAPLFEDKVVDFVLEMATVTDHEIDAEDLRRKAEAGEV